MANKEKDKDRFWFSHDMDAFEDPKIVALHAHYGMAGYGRWWRLVETLRREQGYRYSIANKFAYPSLAKNLDCTVAEATEFIQKCIHEFELIATDDEYIWSESLLARMAHWDKKRESYSNRGRLGAEKTNTKRATQKQEEQQEQAAQADALKSLEKSYEEMEKTDKNINAFIKEHRPAFIEPYVDYWNVFATKYDVPKCDVINAKRRKGFKARIKEPAFDIMKILGRAAKSDFLIKEMRVAFDWIMLSPNNYVKILEGNYDNKVKPAAPQQQGGVKDADDELAELIKQKKLNNDGQH